MISGNVSDKSTNEIIIGANVFIVGTNMGAATDIDGNFKISNVPYGTYSIRVSSIGFSTITQQVLVEGTTLNLNFEMVPSSEALEALEVFASRTLLLLLIMMQKKSKYIGIKRNTINS